MSQPKPANFYSQIDGLRCFCVIGVLMQHFIDPRYTRFFYTADIGVDLFFVISGFLITEILIKMKQKQSAKRTLYVFYTRRILRIFPLYYLYWFLLFLFFYDKVRDSITWGMLYIYNFYSIGHDNIQVSGHLWSLGVEEQFYMIWPLILMLLPFKRIRIGIIVLLLLAVAFLLYNFSPNSYAITYFHTLSCSVSLLTGALLAYLKLFHTETLKRYLPYLSWTVPVALLGTLAICTLVAIHKLGEGYLILFRFFVCIAGFYLIGRMSLNPFTGFWGRVLDNKWAKKIGQISYGIYIYHMLVFIVVAPYVNAAFTKLTEFAIFETRFLRYIKYNPSFIKMPVYALLVIIVAWLSYVIYEMRFLKLKRLFQ
jgi:peptidoglycan/LPS O-acetylase OafA/YrhL